MPAPRPRPARGVADPEDSVPTPDPWFDEVVDEFITSARALVALAVRSINAAPVEVTLMQHRVLVLLASRGDQSVNALADELGVNASNASRVCDRLQRLGLLSRRRSSRDARSVTISITTEGRGVLEAVRSHRRTEVRAVLRRLPAAEVSGAVDALRSFNQAAHEAADGDWVDHPKTAEDLGRSASAW